MFSRLASLLGLRAKPLTPEALAATMQRALAALHSGDSRRAEALVHGAVEQAATEAGRDSRLYAQALFNEATILRAAGDLARAAEACRAADKVPAAGRAAQKDRLTCRTTLGELLTRLGRLDEAEEILREGLTERKALYGAESLEYAGGLAPLAENLLAEGRVAEAESLIEQAVEINWEAGHEAVAGDLAIRAFVVKASRGPEASAFDHWEKLPPHMQEMLVANCVERAERADPHAAQAVLLELRKRLQRTPDVEVLPLASVNTRLASIARLTGDHDVRIDACRMAIKLAGGMDDPQHVVDAWQHLAEALEDAGRPAEAEQAYRSGLERARSTTSLRRGRGAADQG